MSAPEIERAPVSETIWQGVEVALSYVRGDPWPYALTMEEGAEGSVMLDIEELCMLRDAIDQHLARRRQDYDSDATNSCLELP